MTKGELLKDKGVLIISPEGPLAASDFERLAAEIDPCIEQNGRLHGLMVHTDVRFEKSPDVAAKSPVAFLPAVADKTADLIKSGGVPRLGIQLDIGEDGVGFDVPQDRRRCHWAASIA